MSGFVIDHCILCWVKGLVINEGCIIKVLL
jgi:hypothetical protein